MGRRLDLLDRLSIAGFLVSGSTLLLNLLWFREPKAYDAEDMPFVSILVPARNEERSIERCVRSLIAQEYPAFELLVLDDRSEDRTAQIVDELAVTDFPASRCAGEGRDLDRSNDKRKLCVIRGRSLPPGWSGKNWACHQLATAAATRSRFLLFTDADTVHAPWALRRAVAQAQRDHLGLLSLMPRQIVASRVERLVVPLLPFQILAYLPLPALERVPAPDIAAANGQFMLFRRELYRRIGGHAAQAMGLAEDVSLARLVKRAGGTVRLGNGASILCCHMYRGSEEVVAGFRRSFTSGFRLGPRLTTGITLMNGIVYLLPFLRCPFSRPARLLALLILALRTALAWRTATPLLSALAHPAGMSLMLWCQLLAAYDAFVSGRSEWKGRTYRLDGMPNCGDSEEWGTA